jgi:hypothetical protein
MFVSGLPVFAVAAFATAATAFQPATLPNVIGPADSGKTITMQRGAHLELRLPERYRWTAPQVHGTAVRLMRIVFIQDPGYLAWSILARARGTATVTAVGYGVPSIQPTCDPGLCAPHLLRVTFVVR